MSFPEGCVPYEHSPAPLPDNEEERHQHLCSLNILDTEPESRFDELTRLCCMIFKVPIALVSLVDKERQWFKSVQGLTVTETSRKVSFCAWTLLPEHPEVLVVENALEDVRFQQNGLVQGPPNIRFYAGCPLIATNGMRLGSLCIIDSTPRKFDADQCNMLANFGEMVVREIEKEKMLEMQKKRSAQLSKEKNQLLRAIDCFNEGILLCNVGQYEWPVLFMNESWEKISGISKDDSMSRGFWEMFELPDGQEDTARAVFEEAIEKQQGFEVTVSPMEGVVPLTDMSVLESMSCVNGGCKSGGCEPTNGCHTSGGGAPPSGMGQRRWLTIQFRCASSDAVDAYMPSIGVPPILQDAQPGADAPVFYFATLSANQTFQAHLSNERTSAMATTAFTALPSSTSAGHQSRSTLAKQAPPAILDNKVDPFDDVRLGPLLGKGAFGRVYRGQWNGATVAIKVLEHSLQPDGGDVLEALLSGQVSHPNIVQTYKYCSRPMTGMCDDDERPMVETWMVMEFCNKGSLSDGVDRGWMRRKNSLFEPDFGTILITATEVAGAMCYLHGRGILHGDLTGNNVLLGASDKDQRKWVAKVADFGLSRVLEGSEVIQTKTIGTVTHMPPELLVNGIMSKPADVFAFGMLLYEVVMGQRPFAGMSHGQIIHAITSGRLPQISSVCPSQLKKFIEQCVAADPAARPTFQQVLTTLEELAEDIVGH